MNNAQSWEEWKKCRQSNWTFKSNSPTEMYPILRYIEPEGNSRVNTEEVTAMIDAITAGDEWTHTFEGANDSNSIRVVVTSEKFIITSNSHQPVHEITDAHHAQEIAGALVAWNFHRNHSDRLAKILANPLICDSVPRSPMVQGNYAANDPRNPHPGFDHQHAFCPNC